MKIILEIIFIELTLIRGRIPIFVIFAVGREKVIH